MKERLMNNISLKLLSFMGAFLLWFIVVNSDDPITTETYHNIPVNVINEEVLAEGNQTYQIVDDTQSVSVMVKGCRSVLNDIESEDISAIADMRELTLNTQIPIRIVINGYEGEYEEAISSPRNLQVKLEEEQTKLFPIVPKTTGTVRDGYVLGEIVAVPENVSIRGPVSVISRISTVEAEVSVSGLSEDTILPSQLVLYDEEGEQIDQSRLANNMGVEGVSVSVQLLKAKKVPLTLDTSEISAAEGYSIAGVKYEPQEVQVAGVADVLAEVEEIVIPSSALRLSGLTSRTEQIIDITEYLPDHISLVNANAGSIAVIISVEKDGTKTYEVSLGSITVNGLSEKLAMSYKTVEVVEVQVRGPEDILKEFEVKDNVSIDLSKFKDPGIYDVPVTVELPEGCTLEKTITVSIILEEK